MKAALLAEQDGTCVICQELTLGDDACLDHDHETGRPRGVLCRLCNSAFGFSKESPERIRGLLYYAVKHYRSAA